MAGRQRALAAVYSNARRQAVLIDELLDISRMTSGKDIAMPDEDGYDLIRKVRGLSGPPAAIPAIALTSLTREQDRREAITAGFHRHLSKPVDLVALVQTVAELVAPLRAS